MDYLLYSLALLFICVPQSVDGQTVTIVTDPAGTPVDGQPGTFDYPILTRLTLMCMAIASDGSPVTVTSYSWTAINCYTRTGGVENPCFYSVGNPTGQNVTSSGGILATDAGTVTCTTTIDGMYYTSDPLKLRISGVSLTGGTEGIIAEGMGDGSNFPRAANVLDDYTYITLDGSEANGDILFRCATGWGPDGADSNDVIGDVYHNNVLLTDQVCNGFVIAQGVGNVVRFPGVYQARVCGNLTISTEGVYTCTLTNSSMMDQSVSIGAYLSTRTAPVVTANMSSSSLAAVDIVLGSSITLNCTSSGSPPDTFTWMKDGVPVTQSTDITTVTYTNTMAVFSSSYTISNVSVSDNGTYTCTVTNPIGSDNNNFIICIPQPIATIPAMVSVSEGESVTITCTATGVPVPSVNWSRADGSSLTDSRYVISDTSSSMVVNEVYQVTRNLTIMNIVRADIGMEYGCTVTNVVDTIQSNVSIIVLFTPTISLEVLDQTKDEGDTTSFTCQATGGPVPTISWYFNGALMADGATHTISETLVNITTINSTLTIMSVESSDVGTYTCNATNVVSSDTSSGVLTVNVASTITTPMEGQQFNITEGSNGSITCTAIGYPIPTVVWQNSTSDGSSLRNNRLVSGSPVNMSTGVGNVTSVSVELMVIGAMRVDTGMYRCSANNSIGSTTRNISITIQCVVSPLVVPENSSIIGVEGNSSVLRFTIINAFPPVTIDNVRWLLTREGNITDITNNTVVDNNMLTFEFNLTAQMYSLTISNIQANYTSRFNLSVSNPAGVDTNFIDLIVEGPPDILVGPTSTIEIDDNNVTLKCDAIAFPQHNITWMFQRTNTGNARMIINASSPDPTMKYLINDDVNSSSFGTLTITDLQYSDRGMYTCVAANTRGAVSAEAMVNIHVMPTNYSIIGGGRINISSQVNLTCTVIGVPLPAIIWQHNGNDINLPSDCVLNSYNASLDFGSGSGFPDCRINQTLNLLDDAVANAVSDPQDIITLGMYELSQLVVESNLIIRSLERSDNGSYTCNVTNMLPETDTVSIVTDSTLVVVLERPDGIENITVEDQGSRWAFITWNIPYNGNSEIMGYIVYIRNVESDSDFVPVTTSTGIGKRQAMPSQYTTTNTSYNVTEDILPAMQYQFSVVACNELGCGELGQPSSTIHAGEEPPETPPVNCDATAIGSTTIMITWSPPEMPNGIITNYSVSYVPGQSLSTADYSTDGNVSVAIGNNDTTYNVSSLRIATNYYVAIAAHTMIGIGPYSNDNCTVQTMEDVPVGPPLNIILTSPTSTSINVNWNPPDPLLRNGIITKHQLNYTEASQPLNWNTVSLDASTAYLIEGLKIFTRYYVSVSAGTQITGLGPFSDPKIIRTVIPTPLNVMITSVSENSVSLSWEKPLMLNEDIMYYQVSYNSDLTSQQFVNITNTNIVLTNLSSGVQYSIVVTAITETGERIDSDTVTDRTLNMAFFQIRLRPIPNCEEWTVDDEEQKLSDIKAEIIQQIVMHCSCEFTSSNIIDDTFSCRGSQGEFRNSVVYRAMITLEVPASITDADNIVAVLSEWVESEPSVRVNRVTLDVDSDCPTILESFNSNDCEIPSDGSNSSSSSSSSSLSVGIIVGAAVAAIVVILLLISAVVIIIMCRRHKSSYSVSKQLQHENVYESAPTKILTTGGHGHPVEKHASNDDIVLEANPAYDQGIRFADKTIKAGNDAEYEVVDTQSRQIKTDDINMVKNPAYAEATFT